jgi:hypothetical protein
MVIYSFWNITHIDGGDVGSAAAIWFAFNG